MHTPGHTPEHLIFQITDTAHADQPLGLLTGDCLFVGDVGRPDLLETAVGIAGSSEQGARQQFAQRRSGSKRCPITCKFCPGTARAAPAARRSARCRRARSATRSCSTRPSSSTTKTRSSAWLLDGQPETPPYFSQMKRVNKAGAALLDTLDAPLPMEGVFLSEILKNGALVIDYRAGTSTARARPRRDPHHAGRLVQQLCGLVCRLRRADLLDRRAGRSGRFAGRATCARLGWTICPAISRRRRSSDLSIDLPKIGVAERCPADRGGRVRAGRAQRQRVRRRAHRRGAPHLLRARCRISLTTCRATSRSSFTAQRAPARRSPPAC